MKLKAGFEDLTEKELQILYGTLLGDSGIHTDGCYIEMWHSKEQEDYMRWKVKNLKNLQMTFHSRFGYDKVTHDYREEIYATSRSHPFVRKIESKFYKKVNGKRLKILPVDVLWSLGPLGIAVWYMDDGSYVADAKTLELCSQSFSEDENKTIIDFFKKKFNIEFNLKTEGEKCVLKAYKDSTKFLDLVRPYIIPSLIYKLGSNFKYSQLRLKKDFEFEYGHRLDNYADGKVGTCGNPAGHGHSAKLTIGVAGKVNPETNMIMDFGDIKKIVKEKIIDKLDHRFLNIDVPEIGYPTVENMVLWIWKELKPFLPNLYFIKLNETSTSECEIESEVDG